MSDFEVLKHYYCQISCGDKDCNGISKISFYRLKFSLDKRIAPDDNEVLKRINRTLFGAKTDVAISMAKFKNELLWASPLWFKRLVIKIL